MSAQVIFAAVTSRLGRRSPGKVIISWILLLGVGRVSHCDRIPVRGWSSFKVAIGSGRPWNSCNRLGRSRNEVKSNRQHGTMISRSALTYFKAFRPNLPHDTNGSPQKPEATASLGIVKGPSASINR